MSADRDLISAVMFLASYTYVDFVKSKSVPTGKFIKFIAFCIVLFVFVLD